jgi:hypothetical protein
MARNLVASKVFLATGRSLSLTDNNHTLPTIAQPDCPPLDQWIDQRRRGPAASSLIWEREKIHELRLFTLASDLNISKLSRNEIDSQYNHLILFAS